MKTTSVIRFAALAAVLLASANVDAWKIDDFDLKERPSPKNALNIVMCLVNLVLTGNISMTSILSCITSRSRAITYAKGDWNYYVDLVVQNGEFLSEKGTIAGSHMKYGKWQKDGADVPNVDNIEFNKQPAKFRAVGQEGNINGVAGYFEIHEEGAPIAKVLFESPLDGDARVIIRQLNTDYLCTDSWYYNPYFTIDVSCYSLKVPQ
ncbi:uncharacterized protein LOC113500821 [Trichoplusia ni]|uniref:Uncharacterized protein LOC113500821 n=1 Tax=Trichoplusia ni TaxID=7111 RepID=A0A7E5WAP1_TRINI|nr:uncharacterized protein LOC113500821 [Trichoplusia ni]